MPDIIPCDFYLFVKLHLSMKGKRYISVETIQKTCTDIFEGISFFRQPKKKCLACVLTMQIAV